MVWPISRKLFPIQYISSNSYNRHMFRQDIDQLLGNSFSVQGAHFFVKGLIILVKPFVLLMFVFSQRVLKRAICRVYLKQKTI